MIQFLQAFTIVFHCFTNVYNCFYTVLQVFSVSFYLADINGCCCDNTLGEESLTIKVFTTVCPLL